MKKITFMKKFYYFHKGIKGGPLPCFVGTQSVEQAFAIFKRPDKKLVDVWFEKEGSIVTYSVSEHDSEEPFEEYGSLKDAAKSEYLDAFRALAAYAREQSAKRKVKKPATKKSPAKSVKKTAKKKVPAKSAKKTVKKNP